MDGALPVVDVIQPLLEVDREQEGPVLLVSIGLISPFQRSEPSDQLSMLRLQYGEGLSLAVTRFVELGNAKLVLGGPVE